jgi:hypothetical protein
MRLATPICLALSLASAPAAAEMARYTKVCNSGERAGQGHCPSDPVLGKSANEWACSRDEETGLIWEIKTTDGLRSQTHTYTWYDKNNEDRLIGFRGRPETCANTLDGKPCNAKNYISAVNTEGLCGAKDWRLPTRMELEDLVDYDQTNPAIAPGYFPNTPSLAFWSGTANTYVAGFAWLVHFISGYSFSYNSENDLHIRAVRAAES